MHLTLSPVRMDTVLTASRCGDVLTLNGQAYDFSDLSEGESRPEPDCPYLMGPVVRVGGVLRMTLLLPHGARPPQETLFPQSILMAEDGPIPLPPFEEPESDPDFVPG